MASSKSKSPELWYCGHCSYGPMSVQVTAACPTCYRQKDYFATYSNDYIPGPSDQARGVDEGESGAGKKKAKSKMKTPPSGRRRDNYAKYENRSATDPSYQARDVDELKTPLYQSAHTVPFQDLNDHLERKNLEERDDTSGHYLSHYHPFPNSSLGLDLERDDSSGMNLEHGASPAKVKIGEPLGLDGSMESESVSMANPNITLGSQKYLQSPRAYYEKLKNLKDEVYNHSALALSLGVGRVGQPFCYPAAITMQTVDWLNTLKDPQSFGYNSQPAIKIFTFPSEVCDNLKACRDIIMATFSNVWRLQEFGFTQNQISILAMDPSRSSVANLLSVPVEEIKALAKMFYCAVCFTESLAGSYLNLIPLVSTLTRSCDKLLSCLHLSIRPPDIDFLDFYSTSAECFRCWDNTVHLLDLAVLVYTGAHVDPLPENLAHIATAFQGSSRIKLQSRSLKCLKSFLGKGQAWIFSLQIDVPQDEIYISASADVFAEIWGPMWNVYSESDSSIIQYNVGGGSIVPWDSEIGQHPQLKENERLGHWMTLSSTFSGSHINEVVNPWLTTGDPSEDDQFEDQGSSESEPEDAAENLHINPRLSDQWHAYARAHPFSGSERILIGAQASPKLVWNRCHCSTHRLTHRLKEKQELHFLNTSSFFHYVDSKNLSMVAGGHGLTLGANITIKTQNGRSCKEVLLEFWENQPDARHPRTLENFWGVMISSCTFNARRVRLTELLGTDGIKNLLKPFRWSNSQIGNKFFNAVSNSDPFALRDLWTGREEWQEELGKVLLTCLRALCQTGYDAKRNEFNALWMSLKSTRPKRVVLKPFEHKWIRMLQDSEDSCAMAVVVKRFLGTSSAEDGPQSCIEEGGWHASSRLETAITINNKIRNSVLETARICEEDCDMWRTADHMWKTRTLDSFSRFNSCPCSPSSPTFIRCLTASMAAAALAPFFRGCKPPEKRGGPPRRVIVVLKYPPIFTTSL